MPAKLTEEIVKERLADLGRGDELRSPYTRTRNKHLIYYGNCGCEHWVKLGNVLNGATCGKCAGWYRTHEEVVDRLDLLGRGDKLLSPYTRRRDEHLIHYGNCGCERWVSLESVLMGSGCGICAGLHRTHEEMATRVAASGEGRKLLSRFTRTKDPHWILFECGHKHDPILCNIINQGQGCGVCAGQHLTHEEIAALVAETEGRVLLSQFTKMSERHWIHFGECGHKHNPVLGNVIYKGQGCGECATHGFKRGEPAYLYLLDSEKFGALQEGVTNINNTYCRISRHVRDGWGFVTKWEFDFGRDAEDVEQVIKKLWRKNFGKEPLTEEDTGRAGGYTETVLVKDVSAEEAIKQIEAEIVRQGLPIRRI